MHPSADQIKAALCPDAYYRDHLKGIFGKPTGDDWHLWNGLCPFHADTRPGSFVINKASGAYRCFSCGAHGGDIIAFHMQRNEISFPETLRQLGGRTHA